MSKADIVNHAILCFTYEDVQAQVRLIDAERAMDDYDDDE